MFTQNDNNPAERKAVVIFSGGQDSTTCLLKAINDYGKKNVSAITFKYGQRHSIELDKAAKILADFNITHNIIDTSVISQVTHNALLDENQEIKPLENSTIPNTFVDGRNALFLLYAAIYAKSLYATDLIIGVSQADFSGYPDCRLEFIQSMEQSLKLAMDYPFKIITPLMYLDKAGVWQLADELGYLDYVITHTHTCYLGIDGGCHTCPSCVLREQGLAKYLAKKPEGRSTDV